MVRMLIACVAALSLAACGARAAPQGGDPDPNVYALAEHQPSDAPALARQAAARGDHRLIGYIGLALTFPGADHAAATRLGHRVIDAGGDHFSSDEEGMRRQRARSFARQWNITMLAIAG